MRILRVRRWMQRLQRVVGVCRLYKNPLPRFLDYLGLLPRGQKHRMRLRNGLAVTVRTGTDDFGVVDEIFIHGIYDKALTRIRGGDVVLDIGAQSGVFALAAAIRRATVLCFEPLQNNLMLLLDNARFNGLADRIIGINLAVAGTSGEMDLYVVANDTGGATFFPAIHPLWLQREEMSRVTVQCVTLGEIFTRHGLAACDCVKMDCEGAEFQIMEHADPEDLQRIRMLIMEYHPNGDIRPVQERLEGLGFTVDVSEAPCILYATQTRPP